MTAATLTLTDFLLARIAEDEEEARDPYWCSTDGLIGPERMLAECEAKRRIVAAYDDLATICDHLPWTNLGGCCQCGTVAHGLMAFATAYSDHPDYREEWRL